MSAGQIQRSIHGSCFIYDMVSQWLVGQFPIAAMQMKMDCSPLQTTNSPPDISTRTDCDLQILWVLILKSFLVGDLLLQGVVDSFFGVCLSLRIYKGGIFR